MGSRLVPSGCCPCFIVHKSAKNKHQEYIMVLSWRFSSVRGISVLDWSTVCEPFLVLSPRERTAAGWREWSWKGGWVEQELVGCPKLYCWSSAELCFVLQVFFIESVCNDPTVVATNVMVSMEAACFVFPRVGFSTCAQLVSYQKTTDILPDSVEG